MSLPEICIRRPIFAIMLNLIVVLFGVVGYMRLPVRELPDVDPPIDQTLHQVGLEADLGTEGDVRHRRPDPGEPFDQEPVPETDPRADDDAAGNDDGGQAGDE